MWPVWVSSVQPARRVGDERRKRKRIEERRIAVKCASADNYVRQPDYTVSGKNFKKVTP